MFDVSRDDITSGSIAQTLLLLAAPLIAQNLVRFAQLVVDAFWVGQLGEEAVAAVGLVFPLISLCMVAGLIAVIGTQIIVSQRVGAEDFSGARRVAFNGVLLTLSLIVPVTVAAILGAKPLLSWSVDTLNPASTVGTPATAYFVAYALGFPAMMASDAMESAFVGWGDSKAALWVNVVTVGVNLVLDPLLIFGVGPFPEMGIEGAGLATAIGGVAGFVLILAYALGLRDSFTFTWDSATLHFDDWRELLDVGLPNVGQRVAQDAVRLVMISVVLAAGGAAGLTAYTLGSRISAIAWIPSGGFQQAAQSIVGQNLGAGNTGRARQTTWTGVGIITVAMAVLGGLQLLFPETIARLFVPDISGDGLAFTVAYLQILAVGYWAIGASYLLRAGFNAARRTRTSMMASLVQYWGVRLPVALGGVYLLDYGVVAVFWGVTISNVLVAIGLGLYYWYETSDGMMERAADRAAESAS
ncbi:MATE family efflux transporter [Haloarchaeobius sp. HME9146]|uniref:MATE family efflux transporter n=1 Tax=Haloarchaeobius sp. HME9146 TaxID=2978732 RepID=UPI0021BF1818|nr:MATE family efflux transporter [Haloarchaeobius sp. HME9146]MCT9095142.1 MATE family efflux transporter [Haloarchaeobius sp. HME9146]